MARIIGGMSRHVGEGVGKVDPTLGNCCCWSSRQGATGEVNFVEEWRHEVGM